MQSSTESIVHFEWVYPQENWELERVQSSSNVHHKSVQCNLQHSSTGQHRKTLYPLLMIPERQLYAIAIKKHLYVFSHSWQLISYILQKHLKMTLKTSWIGGIRLWSGPHSHRQSMPSWWHPLQQPNAHLACTLPCTLCTCNKFWTRLVVMMMPLTTVVTAETNHKSKNQHSQQPTKHHYKKSTLLQWWVYGQRFRFQHMLKN